MAHGQGVYGQRSGGIFGDSFLSAIEAAGQDCLVKVKLKGLDGLLRSQHWQTIPAQPGTAYCQFDYQCEGWEQPRRFVGIRTLQQTLSVWLRWRAELATFREWFIHTVGKLVRHARRGTLKMQSSYHYRLRWEAIYRQVCRLQL